MDPKKYIGPYSWGIASAETGKVTKEEDLIDPKRFIRNRVSQFSTAYGPFQITKSLVVLALSKVEGPRDVKSWAREVFVPHGNKMLEAKPSDGVYGLGKAGTLTGGEDREMYLKMASWLLKHTLEVNDTITGAIGEWRFGRKQAKTILVADAPYYEKVIEGAFTWIGAHPLDKPTLWSSL